MDEIVMTIVETYSASCSRPAANNNNIDETSFQFSIFTRETFA